MLEKKEYEDIEDMPADAYIEPEPKSDDKLLEALLGTPDVEKRSVYMKRFDANFEIRSVSSEEYAQMEKRCKYPVKNKRTRQIEEKLNNEKLSDLLILTACVKPDWGNSKLLDKYGTDDPAKVIRKRLLIGEISELTQEIMDVSGFSDGLEEAKNS